MRIVAARPEDAATLTTIAFTAKRHWGYPESWIRRWENQLTITPDYIAAHPAYVAADDDEIVGFCAVCLFPGEAVIDHLWVVPPAMNRGIGRSLFQHAEQFAKKSGLRRIKVEADPNAEGFYHRMEAKTVGRKPADVDGQQRFLPSWRKTLAELGGDQVIPDSIPAVCLRRRAPASDSHTKAGPALVAGLPLPD